MTGPADPGRATGREDTARRSGAGRRRGGRRRGERLMVPEAEFTSYYGRPIIKPPVWKVPDVPAYLYLGGLAGVSAPLAALGDATGRPALRRVGRLAAAGGATTSVVFLIHDLGRPLRFLHMLRIVKPTSPLSVGSWILAPFGAVSAAAAAAELVGPRLGDPALVRRAGAASGWAAAAIGPALCTYTAVLLADTAVPAWHEAHRELPFLFAGSAMASGGGLGLLAGPLRGSRWAPTGARDHLPWTRDRRAFRETRPARAVAVTGAVLELAASAALERRIGLAAEAYRTGRAGTVLRAARAGTVAGTAGALASARVRGRRGRLLGALSGLVLNAAAAATRYGVFEAGMASARDPRYTVVPQRERLAARAAANGSPAGSA